MLPVFTLWCEIVNLVASLFPVECIQTPVSDSLAVTSLKKEIYLTIGDREYGDMLSNINNFLQRIEKYRITALDYEIYNGSHSSYVKPMIRKSLLKYYNKEK